MSLPTLGFPIMVAVGIVLVGSIALDTITTPTTKKERVLGGSAIYASLAISPFTQARLIGIIGEDFPSEYRERLESKGIDTSGIERVPGKTFAWEGSYDRNLSEAKSHSTCLNVFENFAPRVPDSYKKEKFLFLGNIDPDLQGSVLDQMGSPDLVATDTIDFWLDLKRDSFIKLLERLDVVFMNEAEAKKISQEPKVVFAAKKISQWGPRVVVIKSGEHGAFAYDGQKDACYVAPAYPVDQVVDPTGAGDSFAGGFLGSLSEEARPFGPQAIKRALYRGNALASFTISSFSVEGLLELTREGLEDRFKTLVAMTQHAPSRKKKEPVIAQ